MTIDADRIRDWATFHDVFAEAFGFPSFYGRNMNAWNDCMGYLGDPEAEMSSIHAPHGGVVTLLLENAASFKERCPEQYLAIIECAAFVNWRLVDRGDLPVLALAFYF